MAERILVVEDDPFILVVSAEVLTRGGYEVFQADSGQAAQAFLRTSPLDVVITDLKMPSVGGLEVLQAAKETDPEIVVILVTGFPTVETAVQAMKAGAADYLVKPFSPEQLVSVVERSLEQRRAREAHGLLRSRLRHELGLSGIVGQAGAILTLFDEIRTAAAVDANVLILGESGSGKELVARAIHENGRRRGMPFVAINCAAIPEGLLEAELFGHEQGAFTGAHAAKPGLLEAAERGTVFLDEVCELTPRLQAKLLRALEERAIRRLAGTRAIPVDVRFMAATNRDMPQELRSERFREDLFFRLDVIEIRVPPLRARREDIPLLAAHFLDAHAAHYGKAIAGITRGAMDLLTRYDWPGNVRELKNAVERAVAYAKGPLVTPQNLPETIVREAERHDRYGFHEWKEKAIERLERDFLERALGEHRGNVTQTARALGIHRSTLQRLMRKHHLAVD